jgi:hypothetical protein
MAIELGGHTLKFTSEQNRRIYRMRKRLQLTFQAFAHAAVMKALVEAEKEHEQQRAKTERKAVTGLGIRERLEAEEEERAARREMAAESPAPAAPVPVSVHVQASSASSMAGIPLLARMVATSTDRRTTMKAACDALAPMCKTEEDAIRLADELEAEIKRIDDKPTSVLDRVRQRMNRGER